MKPSSKKEFSIVIDGQTYFVKVTELAGGELEVELDGSIHRVSMAEVAGKDNLSQTLGTTKIAVPATAVPIPPTRRTTAGGENHLAAPMPGDIVQILVKPGDQVCIGQELCVLEAMKMKNILRSSRDGVVESIEVTLGQSVKFGDVLVRFKS